MTPTTRRAGKPHQNPRNPPPPPGKIASRAARAERSTGDEPCAPCVPMRGSVTYVTTRARLFVGTGRPLLALALRLARVRVLVLVRPVGHWRPKGRTRRAAPHERAQVTAVSRGWLGKVKMPGWWRALVNREHPRPVLSLPAELTAALLVSRVHDVRRRPDESYYSMGHGMLVG
ncbi:hypothetical protein E2562_006191 [Oryza meyeriana var. granulata]|uniref:Uncharacterized protein n=1 Tax=Oryza meyeriana var. granulata TaxID=110450 RepID=A0A6G1CNJ0_9ORYZ|nr:hypothetical protein E2562_006191 [Oryza meyeriana var. granulata]